VPKLGARAAYLKQSIDDRLVEHKLYIREHGQDMPEILGWRWGHGHAAAGSDVGSTEADNV
jgi:xylulose-5-phosphate/fructose-6-phosphate phosphoketolase